MKSYTTTEGLSSALNGRFSAPSGMTETEQWLSQAQVLLTLMREDIFILLKNHEGCYTSFLSPLIMLGLYQTAHDCYLVDLREDAKHPHSGTPENGDVTRDDPAISAKKHLEVHLREMHQANQNVEAMLEDILPLISKAYPQQEFSRMDLIENAKFATNHLKRKIE